jgi:hypothetical protein
MMDHTQYRRALLANPRDASPELAHHRAGCEECREFTAQVMRFENRLEQALQVDVGGDAGGAASRDPSANVLPFRRKAARAGQRPVPARRRWLALAASVLMAALVGGGLWLAVPGYSLAAAVVDHMAEEPKAWARTDEPVADAALNAVLNDAHVRLARDAGVVTYANSCGFRGHTVPHLVVQTADGPVTVMVLTHEKVHGRMHFNEGGYRGVLVPVAGHGSLAVLGRDASTDSKAVDATAAQVLAAIDWAD